MFKITGTSDQPVNTAITVTLNGQNYTTTTDASGNWSVTVPASAVTAPGRLYGNGGGDQRYRQQRHRQP